MSKYNKYSNKGKGKPGAAALARPTIPLPSSAQELEQVLSSLLSPDTNQIKASTEIINQFIKTPKAALALMQQVAHTNMEASRQMAAVLLRKVIVKLWKGIEPNDQQQIVR